MADGSRSSGIASILDRSPIPVTTAGDGDEAQGGQGNGVRCWRPRVVGRTNPETAPLTENGQASCRSLPIVAREGHDGRIHTMYSRPLVAGRT